MDYSKISSSKRLNEMFKLQSQLESKKDLLELVIKIKNGQLKLDDLIISTNETIHLMETELCKIDDIEKNKYKLFYPDPCNENDCAMCGKPRTEHYFPKDNGREKPFCNRF